MPRVAFDCSPLSRPHPWSVVRTVRPLLAALEARGRLDVVRVEPPASAPLVAWRQTGLVTAARRVGADGIHSFLSAFPLRGRLERVQTVHEMPWKHGARENAGPRHRLWVRLGARFADAVVTPSEVVARDLREHAGRVHVVPWGVDPAFRPEPLATDADLRQRHGLPEGPFVLALGANRPKKNLPALLAGVRRMTVPLPVVVTGAPTECLERALAGATDVHALGHVPDADLPGLVRLAAVVPVLSISEGFALPVLEALASGTPVVAARGSSQAATAGGHAIEVDPRDADEVAHGLARAVGTGEVERAGGVGYAGGFTWGRTAEGLETVWSSL